MPPPGKSSRKRKESFPWALWLILLTSLYVFWVLPHQLPKAPVKVEFTHPTTP